MAWSTGKEAPATNGEDYDRVVLSSNEPEAIFDIGTETTFIIIQSDSDNGGDIHIGWDDNVDDTTGFPLEPGDILTATLDVSEQNIWAYALNNNDIIWQMAMS